MGEHDAFWSAIGAAPEDKLPRLVFADWLEDRAGMVDCGRCGPPRMFPPYQWVCPTCNGTGRVSNGHTETAVALRATVEKFPDIVGDRLPFVWWTPPGVGAPAHIIEDDDIFDLLTPDADTTDYRGTPGRVDSHKHYPTAADAIRDLCRAWVASRSKQEVPT